MITDETVDKAALAGLNAVRTANGFRSLASIEELPPDDTYRWRQEYRAALEAVAPDIRNAALEDARKTAVVAWLKMPHGDIHDASALADACNAAADQIATLKTGGPS